MLSRRGFLAASGGIIAGLATPNKLLASEAPIYAGWVPNKQATHTFKNNHTVPMFAQAARQLAGSGAGKKIKLWKFFEKVTNEQFAPHDQTIGDCVAQGWALGIDILDAIQIAHGQGEWKAKCATEIIYAGGRIEIGNGRIRGDGMHGSWAGQWCENYGVLVRQAYLNDKFDFTKYSGSKSRKWAHKCNRCTTWGGGVPDELEILAKEHCVKTITLVKSWEEARDAVYNGYPVAICSNYGFGDRWPNTKHSTRDRDGFVKQRGVWYHCLLMAGMDDTNSRPGGLLINSWGTDWISGPTRLDQPTGSFWVDANVIDSMMGYEDSFAMSNYSGYPKQYLDYKLY